MEGVQLIETGRVAPSRARSWITGMQNHKKKYGSDGNGNKPSGMIAGACQLMEKGCRRFGNKPTRRARPDERVPMHEGGYVSTLESAGTIASRLISLLKLVPSATQ